MFDRPLLENTVMCYKRTSLTYCKITLKLYLSFIGLCPRLD